MAVSAHESATRTGLTDMTVVASKSDLVESGVPYPLRLTAGYVWRLLLVGIGIYLVLWVLDLFRPLVVPFFIAVLLSALLQPLVAQLTRWMSRGLAVLVSMLLAVGVVSGLFTLVGTQISSQMAQLTAQAVDGFDKLRTWLEEGPLKLGSAEITSYVNGLLDKVTANTREIAAQALNFTATAGEVLTGIVLVLFTLIFLLLDGRQIWNWLLRFVPKAGRDRADQAGQAGWVSLSAYVRATVMVAAVDAIGIGAGAAILGVPLAIPLGVLVFIGAFIPIVGSLFSGAVAVLVALLALGWVKALIMMAIVIGVQQLESHVLQPILMGKMVSLHALGVVFALGAGMIIDGITGALFAVPLAAVLNTVVKALSRHSDPAVTGEPPTATTEAAETAPEPHMADTVEPVEVPPARG